MDKNKTIGEILDSMGGRERVAPDSNGDVAGEHSIFSVEVKFYALCSDPIYAGRDGGKHRGILQVSCGGTAIMQFHPVNPCRRPILLIVDDRDGEAWEHRRNEFVREHDGSDYGHNLGPRPHERLRLVQTA